MPLRRVLTALLICVILNPLALAGSAPGPKNKVIMLGMIHSGHVDSERYGLPVLDKVLRAIDPDYVITEIPPDRLAKAAAGFAATGAVTEPRVLRFPEYNDVLFPLTKEMDFKMQELAKIN